jgi:hypothetical protein
MSPVGQSPPRSASDGKTGKIEQFKVQNAILRDRCFPIAQQP